MCTDCMGNFLKSVEAFTGKCQNCNEYYENDTNDSCQRCGEYFDDFYNVSEEGENKDEQIRDWIETWHYDNEGLLTPEVMASELDIGLFEAKDWIERYQESEADFKMDDSGSAVNTMEELNMGGFTFESHLDLEELSTEEGEWDHLPHAKKDIDEESFKSFYDSLNSEQGYHHMEDNAVMTSDDQVKLMQDLGIANKTLRDMGYNNLQKNEEGFMDEIEKLANKFGVNLDRDEEQVESKANEEIIPDWNYNADDNDSDEEPYDDSDDMYDLLRDQQRDEEEKEKEKKSNEDYPPTLPEGKRHCPRCGGGGEIDKDVYGQPLGGIYKCDRCDGFGLLDTNESAGQDFDENDDDDSEDIDNNFQKADPNPEKKITLSEDEMLSKSSESYKALTNNPHIQLNF